MTPPPPPPGIRPHSQVMQKPNRPRNVNPLNEKNTISRKLSLINDRLVKLEESKNVNNSQLPQHQTKRSIPCENVKYLNSQTLTSKDLCETNQPTKKANLSSNDLSSNNLSLKVLLLRRIIIIKIK